MKRYFWEAAVLAVLVLILRFMFALRPIPLTCIGAAGFFLLPVVDRCIRRNNETRVEFFEITAYLEQLLCSYKRRSKIPSAIEDCSKLYPVKSRMGYVLQQALYILRTGEGVRNNAIVETALKKVEDLYPSRRMRMIHIFLCRAEKTGGEKEEELDILLRDLQMWKRRVLLYQKKKQYIRGESAAATILSILLCYLSIRLIHWNLRERLTGTDVLQYTTAVVILFLIGAEVFLLHRLTGSWLDIQRLNAAERRRRMKSYRKVKSGGKGISGYLAGRFCQREVEREFPFWLLSLTLYLQQEGVYQAIQMCRTQREDFFDEEVQRLLDAIYENPSGLQPFLDFFKELELAELQTGMKLLYAVGSNSRADTGRQLRFLVEQNSIVMDQSERNRFDSQAAGMAFIKQIPLIIACVKVVFDLILLLMITMGGYLII